MLCRADDEADRQALVRQQNKVAALEAQLAALKVWSCVHVPCVVSGCRGVWMAGYLQHGCTSSTTIHVDSIGALQHNVLLCRHATSSHP
jgi:hypothetical protein